MVIRLILSAYPSISGEGNLVIMDRTRHKINYFTISRFVSDVIRGGHKTKDSLRAVCSFRLTNPAYIC